jgi:hypothetical protein
MKIYWGGGIGPQLLTSALDGGEWSSSGTGCFTLVERATGTHRIAGSVDSRAGLDAVEKREKSLVPARN